jgi:hypothetical protein
MRNGAARFLLPFVLAFLAVSFLGSSAHPTPRDMSVMVQTPPMGWNTWDSWGLTVDEQQFRDSVTWFHNNLQRFSWQYVVIDEGWFLQHPELPAGRQDPTLSDDGRTMPAVDRFPSAEGGKGFRPLADWVHSLGLKFGIHIVRGIPRASQAPTSPLPTPPTPPTPASGTPTITASTTPKPLRHTTTPSPTSTPGGASTTSKSTASPARGKPTRFT